MPKINRVLVRTEDIEFGNRITEELRGRGVEVRVTDSLDRVGYALLGEEKGRLPQTYGEVLQAAFSYFIGLDFARYVVGKFKGNNNVDFVIFDPHVSREHAVNRRFLDRDARALGNNFHTLDRFHFLENLPLGWERNYLSDMHYLNASHMLDTPDEFVRGLVFMQELKAAGRSQWGGHHPDFHFVLASDNPEMKKYAKRMLSYGFLDYSGGKTELEDVKWDFDPRPEQQEMLCTVRSYLSSQARTAIAASMLAAPALSIVDMAAPGIVAAANAQAIVVDTKTRPYGQSEHIIIANGDGFSVGFDAKTNLTGRKDTLAFKILTKKGPVFFYVNENGEMEAKAGYKLKENIELDVGGGSNGLVHTGVLYNRLKPFGFGIAYKHDEKASEVRGFLWAYTHGFFAGASKINDSASLILAHPSRNHGGALVYSFNYGIKNGRQNHQLIVGDKSNEGFYNMSSDDTWFALHDGQIFGPASSVGNSPFRFINPPVAWRVRDIGAEYAFRQMRNGQEHEASFAKYLTSNNYVQGNLALRDGSTEFRVDAGRNTERLSYNVGVGYDLVKKQPVAILEFRFKL